jgi:hypothetical protein
MKDFGKSQVIRDGFTQVCNYTHPPKKFVRPSVCVQIVSGTYRLNALLDVDDTWYSISHRFKTDRVIKVLKALVEAQGHKPR